MSQIAVMKAQQEMKLSDLWERASKELIQIKNDVGDGEKTACAIGAILIMGGINPHTNGGLAKLSKLTRPMSDALRKEGFQSIIYMNDLENWSFVDFSNFARLHGL